MAASLGAARFNGRLPGMRSEGGDGGAEGRGEKTYNHFLSCSKCVQCYMSVASCYSDLVHKTVPGRLTDNPEQLGQKQ